MSSGFSRPVGLIAPLGESVLTPLGDGCCAAADKNGSKHASSDRACVHNLFFTSSSISEEVSRGSRVVMYCQPDRRLGRMRPFHAMAAMRGDVDKVARFEHDRARIVVEREPCLTAQHQDPFSQWLVVPESRRARLSGRNNPFDSQTRPFQKVAELLGRMVGRPIREHVLYARRVDPLLHHGRRFVIGHLDDEILHDFLRAPVARNGMQLARCFVERFARAQPAHRPIVEP